MSGAYIRQDFPARCTGRRESIRSYRSSDEIPSSEMASAGSVVLSGPSSPPPPPSFSGVSLVGDGEIEVCEQGELPLAYETQNKAKAYGNV